MRLDVMQSHLLHATGCLTVYKTLNMQIFIFILMQGQLLAMTDRLLPKLPISKRHLVIGGVVVVLAELVYRYLKS